MMLSSYTDEHFKNRFIPDSYASREHFRERVLSFRVMCDQALGKLSTGTEAVGDRDKVTETVGVYEAVDTCRHALDETLRQLGPAVTPPLAGPTDPFAILKMLAQRFPSLVKCMKTRRPPDPPLVMEDEYDVQFLFQGLLALYVDDIRPEEPGRALRAAPRQPTTCFASRRPSSSSR